MPWNSLEPSLQALTLRTLLLHLPHLNCRETVIALWSLGKMRFSYRRGLSRALGATALAAADQPHRSESAAAGERGLASAMSQLEQRFHREVAAKLGEVAPRMSPFDTESLLVGLGHMEVSAHTAQ